MPFLILGLSAYVWIALISLLFLIMIVALGGYGFGEVDADVDVDVDYGEFGGPGISPLSLPLVASFGTTFGAVGAILEQAAVNEFLVAGIAAATAIIISAALYFAVQKFLVQAQASTEVHVDALVGKDAQVTIPIREDSQGQILVITPERGRSLFPAMAKEDLARGAIVEIVAVTGGVANVRKKPS